MTACWGCNAFTYMGQWWAVALLSFRRGLLHLVLRVGLGWFRENQNT